MQSYTAGILTDGFLQAARPLLPGWVQDYEVLLIRLEIEERTPNFNEALDKFLVRWNMERTRAGEARAGEARAAKNAPKQRK